MLLALIAIVVATNGCFGCAPPSGLDGGEGEGEGEGDPADRLDGGAHLGDAGAISDGGPPDSVDGGAISDGGPPDSVDGGAISDGGPPDSVDGGTDPLDDGGSRWDGFDAGPDLDGDTCLSAEGPLALDIDVVRALAPAGDLDYVAFTLPAIADVRIQTSDPDSVTCSYDNVVRLFAYDCSTELAAADDQAVTHCGVLDPEDHVAVRQLRAGSYYVSVEEYGNDRVIPAYQLRVTMESRCGNGVREGFEECDGTPECSDRCRLPAVCGDVDIEHPESCEDDDDAGGDGCSQRCAIEPGFACDPAVYPSTCAAAETACDDEGDDDGDDAGDCDDPDCAAGCAALPCGADEALHVFNALHLPVPIPDLASASSVVSVPLEAAVARAAVRLHVTHSYDGDLDVVLAAPSGSERELSSDNGESGNDYLATLFDDECATPITAGSPPFAGCYRPEQPLSSLIGHSAFGQWTLRASDDTINDVGVLEGWSLVLCVERQ